VPANFGKQLSNPQTDTCREEPQTEVKKWARSSLKTRPLRRARRAGGSNVREPATGNIVRHGQAAAFAYFIASYTILPPTIVISGLMAEISSTGTVR
jgi:hypothetical protein